MDREMLVQALETMTAHYQVMDTPAGVVDSLNLDLELVKEAVELIVGQASSPVLGGLLAVIDPYDCAVHGFVLGVLMGRMEIAQDGG